MAWITQFVAGLAALSNSLSQQETNGNSSWGTIPSPNLPQFLGDGYSFGSSPWGGWQPGGSAPYTGKTRCYEFAITRAFKSPDGYNKSVILINDQYPGPLIEANWGDTIEVKVTNKIDTELAEGTSLHWHGFLQKKTPWYDGVPGVSQCPIAPGGTFTYRFQADSYGTTWYHSHFASQYNDGLVGPIVVHGPPRLDVHYDHDLGPIILQDLTHENYYDVTKGVLSKPPVFPNIDSNLINGKGIYDCSLVKDGTACTDNAGFAKFNLTSGKTHLLRFINSGGAANQKVTLDNHSFTVIANDFVPLKPYKTKVLTLGIGQRTDVLVKGTGNPTDAVWLRSYIDTAWDCFNLTYTNSIAMAAVYYEKADTASIPATKNTTEPESNHCRGDPLSQTIPLYPSRPPRSPATTQELLITIGLNETGNVVFFVNDQQFRTNYNAPILSLAQQDNMSFPEHSSVYNFGSNTSVRVIWNNTYNMQHPIHLHGHDFWVLAEGVGQWNGSVVNEANPLRRDTYIVPPGSPDQPTFVVFEWLQDNPGVWPMHCHTAIHISAGLYINVLEQPEKIRQEMQIPSVIQETCDSWAAFSNSKFVDQIDSGL